MKNVVIIFAIIIGIGFLVTKPSGGGGGDDMGEYDLEGTTLDAVVAQNDVVLVDFWAPWCGPCRTMNPVVAKIGKSGDAKVVKINVDDNPALAQQFNIRSIPAFVIFKDGKVAGREVGVVPAKALTRHF